MLARSEIDEVMDRYLPYYCFITSVEESKSLLDDSIRFSPMTEEGIMMMTYAYGGHHEGKLFTIESMDNIDLWPFLYQVHSYLGGRMITIDCSLFRYVDKEELRTNYIRLRQLITDYDVKLVVWDQAEELFAKSKAWSLLHSAYINNVLRPKLASAIHAFLIPDDISIFNNRIHCRNLFVHHLEPNASRA